jgi:hypothetical protein
LGAQAFYLVRERWLRFKLLLEFADDELRRTNPELCVPRSRYCTTHSHVSAFACERNPRG